MIPPAKASRSASWKAALVIFLYGVLVAVLVQPWQEYLVIDDWIGAWSVQTLYQGGRVAFLDWSVHYFLTQLFWGALFCLPGGFSLGALHVSTFVLSLLGLWAFYGILRELEVRPGIAWIGVFSMAVMPPFFILSLSFAGEVPLWTLMIVAMYCFIIGQKRQKESLIWWGVLVCVLAFFIRQYAVAPILALLLYRILNRKRQYFDFLELLPVLVFGFVCGLLYLVCLTFFGTEAAPALRPMIFYEYYSSYFADVLYKSLRGLLNLSLLLSPLTLPLLGLQRIRRHLYGILLVAALCVIGQYSQDAFPTPLLGTYVFNFHELGQSRTFLSGEFGTRQLPLWFDEMAVVVSLISAGILIVSLGETLNHYRSLMGDVHLLAFLQLVFMALLMALLWQFHDRYYIWLSPWLILFLCRRPEWTLPRRVVAALLCVPWFVLSVTGTLDHIAHQKILKQAYDYMTRDETSPVSPKIIDAGFTFNGWYVFAHPEAAAPGALTRAHVHGVTTVNERAFWVLAKEDLPGYQTWKTFSPSVNYWASGSDVDVLFFKIEVRENKPPKKKKKKKNRNT
ncbi:MAG: glycosyltransferase family 39 protein [Verrucomicrobiae bacterium]|nr:glycosyltransferase family 39 protein [Verrucomicrobiae bacterium]